MKTVVFTTVVGLLLFALGGITHAETETFDSQASVTANGWVEFGSRDNQFNFGFSPTNNAEGASGGEGGGLMARSAPRGYFSDVSAIARDLTADLNASGRLKFQDVNFDGEFFFGWFDTTLAENDERAYMGIQILEQRAEGWRVLAAVNEDGTPPADVTPPCNSCDGELLFIPDNTAFNFALGWDADGGDAPGDGKVTLTLTSLDGSQTFESNAQAPVDTISGFNAFGLLGNSQAPRSDLGNFWFDDLEYTLDERKPPGDFNEDGKIDMADFQILASNFHTGTVFSQGDNNFDGRVDLRDFIEFRVLFRAQPPQAAAAAVPEPNSLALLSIGGAALLLATRRRTCEVTTTWIHIDNNHKSISRRCRLGRTPTRTNRGDFR